MSIRVSLLASGVSDPYVNIGQSGKYDPPTGWKALLTSETAMKLRAARPTCGSGTLKINTFRAPFESKNQNSYFFIILRARLIILAGFLFIASLSWHDINLGCVYQFMIIYPLIIFLSKLQ